MQKLSHKMLLVILVLCIIGLCGCTKEKEVVVDKTMIEQLLKDVYTPESLEEFKNSKEYYISNGLITQEEADALFVVADGVKELTSDDLARTISISSVEYSSTGSNSVKVDLYKAKCILKYRNNSTSFEILFSVNDSGAIYKHETNIL